MTYYNTLNVRLSNSQLNRLKLGIESGTEITLKLSSNIVGSSNDENNFSHKLLRKTGLPLMKNVVTPLAKSVLIPLGLTVVESPKDAAIYKKMFASGITTWVISNEEMNDIMKIVKCLKESGLSIKDARGTIKNEAKNKNKKENFLECY